MGWWGRGVIVNITMQRQNSGLGRSDSHKRVRTIFEEEEALSKAFDVNNFYTNQRLNIAELKHRLELFKRTHNADCSPQQQHPVHSSKPQQRSIFNQTLPEDLQVEAELVEQLSAPKFTTSQLKHATRKPMENSADDSPQPTRQRFLTQGKLRKEDVQRKEEAKQANYRIIMQARKTRYQPKTKTAFATRNSPIAPPLDALLRNKPTKNSRDKTEYSKCTSKSLSNSWVQLGVQGRILVESPEQLQTLEKQLMCLWEHYQLLTKMLLGLKGERQEKAAIVRYIDDVCSERFQFVMELLWNIQRENPQKEEALFMKRLKKALVLGKLYENLSVVYSSLLICLHSKPDTHLVNFLGYSCSNAVFLLKFVLLTHRLAHPLTLSDHTLDVLSAISEFQQESYRMHIERMGELVLRMEHNNEVLGILQTRVCGRMGKDFQQTVNGFLKPNDSDQPTFLQQYAHYIFEFLAYHLARCGIIGEFSPVQIAPSPYLSLPKQRTLIIEPWGVLFAMRGENTYIRANSEAFLREVGKHWNIVYWTDLMPDKVDDLLPKLPPGKTLYRYHCRYENHRFLKLLWRVGCDIDNTIIIDREEGNFQHDRDMGVELPWAGKSRDGKLLDALQIFLPLLASNPHIPLRKTFPMVKEELYNLRMKTQQRRKTGGKLGMLKRSKGEEESVYPRLLLGK